jgi:biopolymer transport protein ExbD
MASSNDENGDVGAAITGINVTPLVDVTLVLLIVFLVTAKVIVNQGLPLDLLPKARTADAVQSVLSVTIDTAGTISLNGVRYGDDADIVRVARAHHERDRDVRAVVHAPSKAEHGHVVRAMDLLRTAEIARIAIAVEKTPPTTRGE